VQSDGLIEKVRTNLCLYSEDQTNWTVQNATTVTANAAANPLNGAVTADKVIPTAVSADHYRGLTMATMNGEITASIYVKADGYNFIDFGIYNSTALAYAVRATFDLSTQTFTFINGSIASITAAGSGYFRISMTGSAASASSIDLYVRVRPTGGSGTFSGNGTSGMLLWGCQLESGVMTDYIGPTTTAAVSVGPVSGLPRLDYLGSTCPRLILEPQRTNLLQYSEQLNNAYWTPDGGTITANTAVAPDGTTSMDRLTETATTNPHQVISTAVTIFGGAARTFSVFVKKGNVRYIQIANVAFGASSASAIFDLDTKTVTDNRASSGAGPAFGFVSASVEDYGNGILRLILVNTCSFDAPTYRIANSNQATFTGATLVDGMVSYAGNASSFTDIWGCQLESASYASSYIPTLGASVTRVADAASKTGISSLIGQTEGTIFADLNLDTRAQFTYFTITPNLTLTSNYIGFLIGSTSIAFEVVTGSALQSSITLSNSATGRFKIAASYKNNDFAFYINGVQVGTAASGTVPACSEIGFYEFAQVPSLKYNQALVFKTRLTNAQLAELTA
jgi:hypothetical protein